VTTRTNHPRLASWDIHALAFDAIDKAGLGLVGVRKIADLLGLTWAWVDHELAPPAIWINADGWRMVADITDAGAVRWDSLGSTGYTDDGTWSCVADVIATFTSLLGVEDEGDDENDDGMGVIDLRGVLEIAAALGFAWSWADYRGDRRAALRITAGKWWVTATSARATGEIQWDARDTFEADRDEDGVWACAEDVTFTLRHLLGIEDEDDDEDGGCGNVSCNDCHDFGDD